MYRETLAEQEFGTDSSFSAKSEQRQEALTTDGSVSGHDANAAAIEKTRLDYQSTRRIEMVANAFPLLRRRNNLNRSHHAADIA